MFCGVSHYAGAFRALIQSSLCMLSAILDTSKNLQSQLAGRKTVFENRRILRYLRIAESSLTHQTTRIEVFRGVLLAMPILKRARSNQRCLRGRIVYCVV